MKVKKFHQFIRIEKGPINTAVIDLLKGNVYQVKNEIIDKFAEGTYEDIREFMQSAAEEELIIEINSKNWIPGDQSDLDTDEEEDNEINIELHVEEGIDLDSLLEKFRGWNIFKVVFYGQELPETRRPPKKIVEKEKDFRKCMKLSCVDGNFNRITHASYLFNRKYNSCWGAKIAVTADGKIRPCIYSEISVGDINTDPCDIDALVEKMKEYWTITKDKVVTCKDCELRHTCFDCREIARRKDGDLPAANTHCHYDPYKGTWKE